LGDIITGHDYGTRSVLSTDIGDDMTPKKSLLAGCVCFALAIACAPTVMADWSGIMDFFKSKGSRVVADDDLAQLTEAAGLSQEQIARGLKEALGKGVQSAVENLGKPDGFLKNVKVKIPMPEHLATVEKGLRAIGRDEMADQFVEGMNRAAERAVPEAAGVFGDAISRMSIDDAKAILNGGDQSATEYLKRTSTDSLKSRFRPIVEEAIGKVGVTKRYQDMVDKAGFAGRLIDLDKLDLSNYVTDKALDGIFLMVGEEERKIRENPAARTTELLKQVFAK